MKRSYMRPLLLLCIGIVAFFAPHPVLAVEPVTITIWTEVYNTDVMEDFIAGFQEEYPWVAVDHHEIDNELWETSLRRGMYSDNPPDLFFTESRAELLEFVDAGLAYDLTEWFEQYGDRFIPGYEMNFMIRGRPYAVPWDIFVLDLLWYNPVMMKKYHLDPTTVRTWDDLLALCDILRQHGEIPFAFGGGDLAWKGGHWALLLLQKNLPPATILKLAKREKKWTDPDVVTALQSFEDIVRKGYVTPDAASIDVKAGRTRYFQGQGAFWQAGSWHLPPKKGGSAPANWEFTFIPFPGFSEDPTQKCAISAGAGQWTVHRKSAHMKEVLLFLEVLTRQTPSAEAWVKETQGFFAIKGAVNESSASPEMVEISRYLERSHVKVFLEAYLPRNVVLDGFWAGSKNILSGEMTTLEWVELLEELHEASGALMLE